MTCAVAQFAWESSKLSEKRINIALLSVFSNSPLKLNMENYQNETDRTESNVFTRVRTSF